MIRINDQLEIPDDDITFDASTSSGPGGQHVNRVQTRVTLSFDLSRSRALDDGDRERIRTKLASRINKAGLLQVRSERHRSQRLNREEAVRRFAALLAAALEPEIPRKKTRVSKAVRERRVAEKKRRSELKEARRRPRSDDG